ncbi:MULTISPECIES: HU family DNA-binding protein [unclassified Alistipes]|uniref:HU family DNA-binding protein n=1 Tax=unclassified Alistipes TaxID=2608932 RepID=UPI0021CD5CF0|nr:MULTISPECIES: HU family DNA-binding protein [unclassified Alistipes]
MNLFTSQAMNKAQFVEAVALDANLTKVEARKAIDAMIRVTVQALREGERLTLTGLGSFSIQQKAERVGRNPRTGAAVKIPARKVIRFRPAVEIE